jgi:PGF-CTERM protein
VKKKKMKTKMKGKSKRGKALIGIAMAAIMVASVMVAMVPTGMSRPVLQPKQVDSGDTIYIGEQGLAFDADQDADYGEALTPDVTATLEAVDEDIADTLSLSATYTVPSVAEGKYFFDANGDGALTLPGEFYIFVKKAAIVGDIILNNAAQDSIVGKTVPKNDEIVFKADLNYGGGKIPLAEFRIVVTDPDGLVIETIDGQDLRNLDATIGTSLYVGDNPVLAAPAPKGVTITAPAYADAIDLAGLDTGTYKVKIKTEKTPCNMLDISSAEMEFTIRSEELAIEAVTDTVSVGDDMIVKVSGNPKGWYYLTVTGVKADEPPAIQDTADVKNLDTFGVAMPTVPAALWLTHPLAAWIQMGSDGIADVKIATASADDRTYTVNVYETALIAPGGAAGNFATDAAVAAAAPANDDDVDIKVQKAKVTFDIPTSVIIGETLTIKGTISAGDTVDVIVKDEFRLADNEPVDENKEFEVKWDTGAPAMTTGSYTIEVYIDEGTVGAIPPAAVTVYNDIDEDGKTGIRLVIPTLTAKQLRHVVAEDDDYTIEGTAAGVDEVDIVLIGPDGYTGGAFDVTTGLEVVSTSVTDDEFSEDIDMGGPGFDTGLWIALVLSPGRDAAYEGSVAALGAPGAGAGGLDAYVLTMGLPGKDQSQVLAIIKDATAEAVGSDDLFEEFRFKVESAYVRLDPIAPVAVGEPLNVTGTTNREPETIITISTFAGPMDLPAVMAEVEWPTADKAVFTGTIDTKDAVPGTYTIEADDGDGQTDTVTVEIVTAVPTVAPPPAPTVTPTEKPTEPPVPTVKPTVEPTVELTPEPPGFEAVFAIAGMLAIAYLVLRRRK